MVLVVLVCIAVALVVFGLLGAAGIAIVAVLGGLVWLVAPIVCLIGLGLVGFIMSPILKALAPDVWEIVNRENLEERRRRDFFRDLERAGAPHVDPRPLQRRDGRGQVYDLTPQLGSLSGPQVRPFEHRAKLPDPLAK